MSGITFKASRDALSTPPKNVKSGVFHEKSRSQFLARTGNIGPVGSKLFKYEPSEGSAQANVVAAQWLKNYLAEHVQA